MKTEINPHWDLNNSFLSIAYYNNNWSKYKTKLPYKEKLIYFWKLRNEITVNN